MNIGEELKGINEDLKHFSNNSQNYIKSVIRYSKSLDKCLGPPSHKEANIFFSMVNKDLQDNFLRVEGTNDIVCRYKGNYLFVALTKEDPSPLLLDLQRVLKEKAANRRGLVYEFIKADTNPWKEECNTIIKFLNVPIVNKNQAETFYSKFGSISHLELHGSFHKIWFKSLNVILPFRWHECYRKNKLKKTVVFKVCESSSFSARFCSKTRCERCKGFGHVTKACPEGLLPLLTELDKKTNAANPPAESSKRDAEGVKGLSDKGDATNAPQEDNPAKTLADGKRPPPLKKGNPPKANVPQSTRKDGTSYNNKSKSAAKVGKDQKSKGGLSESSKKKTKKKLELNSFEDEQLDDLCDNPDYDTDFVPSDEDLDS